MTPARRTSRHRKLQLLAGFGLWFGALWVFWNTPVVYPVQVFVVFLHEISHALAALATGGHVVRIELTPRLGGLCHCPGGNAFVTLSAGYLGSLLWGGLLFEAGRTSASRAPVLLSTVGIGVVLLTLLWVRGPFGLLFGLLFGSALALAAPRLGRGAARVALMALGLTSVLYAILDMKSDILDRPHLRSDARMLAELTGVPTVAWGLLWIGLALAFAGWLLHRAWTKA